MVVFNIIFEFDWNENEKPAEFMSNMLLRITLTYRLKELQARNNNKKEYDTCCAHEFNCFFFSRAFWLPVVYYNF